MNSFVPPSRSLHRRWQLDNSKVRFEKKSTGYKKGKENTEIKTQRKRKNNCFTVDVVLRLGLNPGNGPNAWPKPSSSSRDAPERWRSADPSGGSGRGWSPETSDEDVEARHGIHRIHPSEIRRRISESA